MLLAGLNDYEMDPVNRTKLISWTLYAICTLAACYYSIDTIIDYLAYEFNTLSTLPTHVAFPRFSFCIDHNEWMLNHSQSVVDIVKNVELNGDFSRSEFYKYNLHCVTYMVMSIVHNITFRIDEFKGNAQLYVHDRQSIPYGLVNYINMTDNYFNNTSEIYFKFQRILKSSLPSPYISH